MISADQLIVAVPHWLLLDLLPADLRNTPIWQKSEDSNRRRFPASIYGLTGRSCTRKVGRAAIELPRIWPRENFPTLC